MDNCWGYNCQKLLVNFKKMFDIQHFSDASVTLDMV